MPAADRRRYRPLDLGRLLSDVLRTTVDQAVLVIGEDGTVAAWAGAAERLFGYSEAEAIGLNYRALFTPDDRELGLDRQEMAVARESGRSEDDRWHVRKDGSTFWAGGLLESVRSPDGSEVLFCKFLRDRTDIRTQVELLQNRLAVLERANEAWERSFVSHGHELRNALGALSNAMTLHSIAPDERTRERAREMASRQISVMERLLSDLPRAATSDSGGPRLNREAVVIQEALELAAGSVREAAEAKGQALRVVVPPVGFTIEADAGRLQQMLLNLLGNAIKYTPAGGHIEMTATVEGQEAVIRIVDDGIGIPTETLPKIFELFTRGDPPADVPGQGVGLAVVRELAALHGGSVDARSPGEGKGSVFALRLPLRAPQALDVARNRRKGDPR
jgi:PAS domain S-box-containing protein